MDIGGCNPPPPLHPEYCLNFGLHPEYYLKVRILRTIKGFTPSLHPAYRLLVS
jgi:hypothetical protein